MITKDPPDTELGIKGSYIHTISNSNSGSSGHRDRVVCDYEDPLDTELGIQGSYIHTTSNTAIQDPPDTGIGFYVSKQEPGMHIVIIIPRTSNRILGSSGHNHMYEIVLLRILRTHRTCVGNIIVIIMARTFNSNSGSSGHNTYKIVLIRILRTQRTCVGNIQDSPD